MWRRLLTLNSRDRLRLAEAATRLIAAGLAVHILPSWVVGRVLEVKCRSAPGRVAAGVAPRPARPTRRADDSKRDRIAWAVRTASHRLQTSCLVEALVAHAMLQCRGYPAALRVAVRRRELGSLVAHAWVECDGVVVVGGLDDLEDYAALSAPWSS
jgi:hypothetical protein